MSAWADEIAALPAGDNNRSVTWCAEELERASTALVEDYRAFLARLVQRRRSEHAWHFVCCEAVKARRGRPSRIP